MLKFLEHLRLRHKSVSSFSLLGVRYANSKQSPYYLDFAVHRMFVRLSPGSISSTAVVKQLGAIHLFRKTIYGGRGYGHILCLLTEKLLISETYVRKCTKINFKKRCEIARVIDNYKHMDGWNFQAQVSLELAAIELYPDLTLQHLD